MWGKRAFRVSLAILAAIGVYAVHLVAIGNFHTVIGGTPYRAAQPSAEDIALWHQRHGSKTIINLRGANPAADWRREEQAAARAVGIRLIDYKMSSKRRDLSATKVEELLGILATAEAPVLIHCRNGVDRSGLVSAFYVAGVAGGSEFFAELQLTPVYGHLPVWFLSAFAMDRSFEMAEPRLGFPDS
jgi:protein tyrosine/serine phosphatase